MNHRETLPPRSASRPFPVDGPAHVTVTTHSGDVVVRVTDAPEIKVTLGARSSKTEYLLKAIDVFFERKSNALTISTLPGGISFSSKGLRVGPRKSWFDFGNSDVDVVVELPANSSCEISTVSGDTSLHGSLGDVRVKSVSGDVVARDTSNALDVQTASGDVNSGRVVRSLKCKSASGDVVCRQAAADTEIFSASGDVELWLINPARSLFVTSPETLKCASRADWPLTSTASPSLGTWGATSTSTPPVTGADDAETIVIKVTTVSGDIRVDKAS